MYRTIHNKSLKYLAVALILSSVIWAYIPSARAAVLLQSRSDQLSNSATSGVTTNLFSFTYTNTTTPVGSISFTFCANDPIIGDPCTYPTGLDLSSATLSNQTGETGFGITANSGGQIVISRNPADPVNTSSSYQFDNIINPSSPGSYYVRLETYSSIDASGPNIEQGGTVFAILPAFTINTEVPPYLTFCAGVSISGLNCSDVVGDQINFGDFSTGFTSKATSQLLTATNAGNGYSVSLDGTTLTSGNNTIPPLTVPTPAKTNTNQFGANLVANSIIGANPVGPGPSQSTSNYSQANKYTFNDGDTVVTSPKPSSFRKYTVSYIVDVNSAQPPGVYATTIDYVCLANF